MSVEAHLPEGLDPVERGRREGFAVCALALSLVSFVNLLGAEKSILAIVLAGFAIRSAARGRARKYGWIAAAIGALHLVTLGVVLVWYRDELARLLDLLLQLG